MTSSTLYREGDDLDTLLGELSQEHGNRVRVLAVDEQGAAGRRGFLTRRRVSVQYRLDLDNEPAPAGDTFAELIARADAAEIGAPSPAPSRVPSPAPAAKPAAKPAAPLVVSTPETNVEFASMLLELAAKKAAERKATTTISAPPAISATPAIAAATAIPAPPTAPAIPAPTIPAIAENRPAPTNRPSPVNRPSPTNRPSPVNRPSPTSRPSPRPAEPAAPTVVEPIAEPMASVRSIRPTIERPVAIERPAAIVAASPPASSGSHAALMLRRRLADIGVPVHLLPSASVDPVAAVTSIVAALPEMPRPPAGRHTILALVGPSADLVLAARRLAPELGVPADRVWIAGLPADALPAAFDLEDAWEAATAARWARDGSGELILALVATDVAPTTSPKHQPDRIVAALEADAVWAVVDASRKPADSRRRLGDVSAATAAVVIQAAETASPATVLELGLPVAMLDGEPATRRRWIAALLAALAHQES